MRFRDESKAGMPRYARDFKIFAPTIAGALSLGAIAFAGSPPLQVLPTTPSPVTYRLQQNVSGPDGIQQRDQRVSLVMRGDAFIAVVSSHKQPEATLSLKLRGGLLVSSDPTITDQQLSTIETLGFLVSLADHPGPITSGDTWTAMTIVDLPGGDRINVPLSVKADSAQGDDVKLSATGTGSGVARAKGHSVNSKIELSLEASFHAGHIVSASTMRKATAHVMFRSLTFTNTSSITP